MTTTTQDERPRLVLTMDPGNLSPAALEAGVRLAASLGRDVVGVYVEDTALVEAAALPFTRMVPGRCAGEPAFDALSMRRALRIWADRARADRNARNP